MAGPSGPAFLYNFYPRSPCGERRLPTALRTPHHKFLSTLSLRRATCTTTITICTALFLSTLSLRRATTIQHTEIDKHNNFYPRSPCGERRARRASRQQPAGISIHALLAESDHAPNHNPCSRSNFYPRSPCGERLSLARYHAVGVLFLSTLSLRRATREPTAFRTPHHIFLSTLSLRRATSADYSCHNVRPDFYPRSPCGERL